MKHLNPEIIKNCKDRLIETKEDLLNRYRSIHQLIAQNAEEKGGDEADQTMRLLREKENLISQKRLRETLYEIECALHRIQLGSFGICEETDEPIHEERLLAIPWTRLSIEGAESREKLFFRDKVD